MTQQTSASGVTAVVEESLDEAGLRAFARAEGAPRELVGRGFVYRHNWGRRNGQWKLDLSWKGFTNKTCVFVAIGEGTGGGGKFVGSARYTLHNVAPDTGHVVIWINIEWGSPINLIVDYLIIEP